MSKKKKGYSSPKKRRRLPENRKENTSILFEISQQNAQS